MYRKNWNNLASVKGMNRRLKKAGISIREGKRDNCQIIGYDVFDLWEEEFLGNGFSGTEGKYPLSWNEVVELVNNLIDTRLE